MKNLFILGSASSGKTAVAAGLAMKFRQLGLKVTYFKPVGNVPGTRDKKDPDAFLMQQLLGIPHPIEQITPCIAGPSYLSGYNQKESLEEIMTAYEKIAAGNDVVIIGGANYPYIMASFGLDAATLAKNMNAAVLYIIRIKNDFSLDEAIFFNDYMQEKGITVVGNIFNNVPRPLQAKTQGVYNEILREKGIKTVGIIPARPEIASPTVAEYYEVLGGEILTGRDKMDRLVEDVIIGAMTIESALGYLRRSPNKAVVTGGDRSDLALAALETSTSALILTGGLYPDVRVISRATEKEVPVILVHMDTYTTIEKLSEVTRQLRPDDQKGLQMAQENIEKYCDWEYILDLLR